MTLDQSVKIIDLAITLDERVRRDILARHEQIRAKCADLLARSDTIPEKIASKEAQEVYNAMNNEIDRVHGRFFPHGFIRGGDRTEAYFSLIWELEILSDSSVVEA